MSQRAVMLSIQPHWCSLIFDDRKVDEVRKNKPNLKPPFKVYIYCSKKGDKYNLRRLYGKNDAREMPGRVCAEFTCSNFTYIQVRKEKEDGIHIGNTALLHTQLTDWELVRYLAGEDAINKEAFDVGGWAWHISSLNVYAEPRELSDFRCFDTGKRLVRPPQSWCYVREL